MTQFYNKKRVFITGHTGFKGTWLTVWLKSMGAEICGYSIDSDQDKYFFNASGIKNEIISVIADIRDYSSLEKAIQEFQPDIIFHLAAQPLVRESYKVPIETYSTNIMGTVNILEISRINQIKTVLNVTSDKCYENQNWIWGYRESDSLGGHDPYSSSKACAEIVSSAYTRSYFNGKEQKWKTCIASARAGNVIGGGDFAKDRLVPDMVKAFSNKRKVIIRNPKAIRPWQHVLEALFGYLILAMKLDKNRHRYSGGWNFGPNTAGIKEVGVIVEKFSSVWKEGASWSIDSGDSPHEEAMLRLDNSKAQTYLGWIPILDTTQMIQWTVEWYKAFRDAPEDILQFTLEQIKEYQVKIDEIY
ncbi:MAG: CDP-glucose 4,6-dehydratase [Desulfobacter sp.]|nr:MAG: CDP-glucose 4,6-dehydratase [Desulfobacter sp.]